MWNGITTLPLLPSVKGNRRQRKDLPLKVAAIEPLLVNYITLQRLLFNGRFMHLLSTALQNGNVNKVCSKCRKKTRGVKYWYVTYCFVSAGRIKNTLRNESFYRLAGQIKCMLFFFIFIDSFIYFCLDRSLKSLFFSQRYVDHDTYLFVARTKSSTLRKYRCHILALPP